METRERLLPLVGAYNFRDLGGYPTVDGRTIRWGRLFRSDTLHELTEADLEVLRDVGLRSVVDLRTATEVERSGRGLLAGEPIGYLHASVLQEESGESQAAPEVPEEDRSERYLWYLDVGREALVRALSLVADPSSQPVVFHCTAGKDRTGVLAALILDILGVEHRVIAEDYAITATRMGLILDRLRRDPIWGERIADVPAERFLVEESTMESFLGGLQERHGGARGWALGAGVSPGTLDAMKALLLAAE